jgi:hypothetical protein
MMEALRSAESCVLSRSTRRNIPEDGFFIVTVVKTSNLTFYDISSNLGYKVKLCVLK